MLKNTDEITQRLHTLYENWEKFHKDMTLQQFKMHISRAYNAGKENMLIQAKDGSNDKFISSNTYFGGEFPDLKDV